MGEVLIDERTRFSRIQQIRGEEGSGCVGAGHLRIVEN